MSISRWMDKKAVIHNGVLLSHLKEYIWINSNEVNEAGTYYTEWSKPERKTPIQYTNAHIWNLKDGNDNPVCETAEETQMYRTVFWTLWERERVGWFGRMALKHVTSCKKWIASPGSMQDIGCSGLVHWDDLEGWHREESWRGVQDGEHMYTMEDSCWCMAKPIQYCKVISLQLK